MPLDYHQDDVQRRLTVTPSGVVTIEETLEVLQQMIAGEAWSYGTLYDARGRTDGLTPTEVRRLASAIERYSVVHGAIGPLAVLAPADITYGMGRLYEIISDDSRQIAIVRSMEAAWGWLDLHQRPAPSAQSAGGQATR